MVTLKEMEEEQSEIPDDIEVNRVVYHRCQQYTEKVYAKNEAIEIRHQYNDLARIRKFGRFWVVYRAKKSW